MAIIRGQSYNVTFYVWNKADLTPYTGSASAITVRISKDGGALATTTNAPTAVDTTNAPGAYRVLLTATEMDANVVDVFPSISDTSYQCEYVTLLTERGMIDAQVSSRAAPGDAMTLTTSERSSIASAVWSATTRTLTSFGTLVSDIWSHSTRTLTSFGSLVSDVANAVWSASTRTLTSFGTLVSDVANAVWTASTRTLTSFGTLANDVATAVWGYTTRTLTSFGTLTTDTANAVWGYTTRTLTSFGTLVNDVANAVWAMVIDGGKSAMGLMRLFAAALLGKVSGAQTNTPIFRDIADTKNRITMTVDNDGNRTGVTLDDS